MWKLYGVSKAEKAGMANQNERRNKTHIVTGKFITLTFSNEELEKLIQETGIQESNAVATIAVRRFLERWRKKYKKV